MISASSAELNKMLVVISVTAHIDKGKYLGVKKIYPHKSVISFEIEKYLKIIEMQVLPCFNNILF